MRIGFKSDLVDEAEIRAGFIGCGSHSFRNLYPTFQFAPVNLISVCDLDGRKAEAFATKFSAKSSYTNHHEMLDNMTTGGIRCIPHCPLIVFELDVMSGWRNHLRPPVRRSCLCRPPLRPQGRT